MSNTNTMSINSLFLSAIDSETKNAILENVANHYGISKFEALEEITDEESEHLLDYLTGSIRTATSLLMKRHNLNA
jgi:hypothetical protein